MKGPHCTRMWYRWITNYPIYLPYVWGWFAQPSNPAVLFCAKRDRHVVSGTILEDILWLHIHGLSLFIMEIFLYKPSYFFKLGIWLSKQNTKCKLNCPYMGWCCLLDGQRTQHEDTIQFLWPYVQTVTITIMSRYVLLGIQNRQAVYTMALKISWFVTTMFPLH